MGKKKDLRTNDVIVLICKFVIANNYGGHN